MDLRNQRTFMMIITALCWGAVTVMAWNQYWFPAMFISILMTVLYLMMGGALKGKLNTRFFLMPIISWGVLWTICFYFAQHYAVTFAGTAPTFSILGFHPSFAWIIIAWVAGVLILSLGLYFNKNLWLTEDEWSSFKLRIKELNNETNG